MKSKVGIRKAKPLTISKARRLNLTSPIRFYLGSIQQCHCHHSVACTAAFTSRLKVLTSCSFSIVVDQRSASSGSFLYYSISSFVCPVRNFKLGPRLTWVDLIWVDISLIQTLANKANDVLLSELVYEYDTWAHGSSGQHLNSSFRFFPPYFFTSKQNLCVFKVSSA